MSGRVVDLDVDFHDASGIVMTAVKPDYNMGDPRHKNNAEILRGTQ